MIASAGGKSPRAHLHPSSRAQYPHPAAGEASIAGRVSRRDPFHLGVVFTHPTQHHAPLWRALNREPDVTVTALYLSTANQERGDGALGTSEPWDTDLLSGYHHEFLTTLSGGVPETTSRYALHPALAARLQRPPFDAVFLPSFVNMSYRLTAILCKSRRIPLIMQNDATFMTDLRYSRRRQLLLSVLYPLLYRLPAYWIASGDHNAIYLRHYGVPDHRILRGCYPVDGARFRDTIATRRPEVREISRRLRWDEHTVLYGFVGKYAEHKNPFEFIEAIVKAHRINPRVRGVMIGGGELESAINERLGALGGEVVSVGFVNQDALPLHYAALDVLVSSSRRDGHPLVVSEAMAAGCPVILSDRCGNWGYSDILQHGHNGLVYPSGDEERLAEAILALAEDASRREYSEHALSTFVAHDVPAAAAVFMEIFERIRCRG